MVIGLSWMNNIIYLSNRDVWKIFSITSANNRKGIKPFKFEDVGLKFVDELDELYRSNKKSQNEIISSFVKIKPRKQTATIDVLNAAKILIKINSN